MPAVSCTNVSPAHLRSRGDSLADDLGRLGEVVLHVIRRAELDDGNLGHSGR